MGEDEMRYSGNFRPVLPLLATTSFLLAVARTASADVNIATVQVGNPGNAVGTYGFGTANYTYNIGKFDVTSGQYAAFLNAVAKTDTFGVYNSAMANSTVGDPGIIRTGSSGSYLYTVSPGRNNNPVTEVSFWDATRFANWLDNGQPMGPEGNGTTETGAYTLTSTAIAQDTVERNANATWAVTSEDEWFKAAYYNPTLNGGASGYWIYPTQSDSISTSQANSLGSGVFDTTPVGDYPYPSYYGTYDQGGNVYQWNESIYYGQFRGLRGWTFNTNPVPSYLTLGDNFDAASAFEYDIGFRVVQVPEPASVAILGIGSIAILGRRRVGRR
jgi:formylglycine-generating enzyme